jgi:hypothetical protein
MSSLQFLFQNLIAKTVFKLGLMQRTAGGMGTWGWREYCKQSEWRAGTHAGCIHPWCMSMQAASWA